MPSEEPSLRDSLESAVQSVEASGTELEQPSPSVSAPPQESGVTREAPPPPPEQQDGGETPPLQQTLYDAPPKSWKAASTKDWATVPPGIRQEIYRREMEMSRSFGENNQARELHRSFSELVRPYEARIRSAGVSPLQAVSELFKADNILSSAPPAQRAAYMAQLIKEYGVDIRELDSALAGEPPVDPVRAQVDRMLQERLQPLNQFLTQQQYIAQQSNQRIAAEATSTIEQMEADTANFPHFNTVRLEMADLIDYYANKGTFVTPVEAYQRAISMNPELASQMASQQLSAAQRQQAQNSHSRAQRALQASASVSGAPGGAPIGGAMNGSLRDTIEAAFSQATGR